MFKLFNPALVFIPVLTASYSLRKTMFNPRLHFNPSAVQDIVVPFTYSVLLSTLSAILFFLLVLFIGRGKHPFVRVSMWCTLFLGNATILPVIILQSLCRTLPNLHQDYEQCNSDATSYSAIFLIPQIVATVS